MFLISQVSFSQDDTIYPISLVDSPPIFKICNQFNDFEQKKCFESTIKSHINNNIKFPEEAFEEGISGRVLIYFIVDTEGKISNIMTRGPHKSLEEEAKRIINLLPDLKPGIKDNVPVKISYSLPIDFYLLSRPSSEDIKVFAGANVYSSPDSRSKIVAVVKNTGLWRASSYGEFW